jgi:hypothetical protein
VGGEKEKAAFMKIRLERKLCAGQEEGTRGLNESKERGLAGLPVECT